MMTFPAAIVKLFALYGLIKIFLVDGTTMYLAI